MPVHNKAMAHRKYGISLHEQRCNLNFHDCNSCTQIVVILAIAKARKASAQLNATRMGQGFQQAWFS